MDASPALRGFHLYLDTCKMNNTLLKPGFLLLRKAMDSIASTRR